MHHNINLTPALAALAAVFEGPQTNGHSGHKPGAGSRRRAAREAAEAKRRQAYYADTPKPVVSRQVIRQGALAEAKRREKRERDETTRQELEAHRAARRAASTPSATAPSSRTRAARPGGEGVWPGRAIVSTRTERA